MLFAHRAKACLREGGEYRLWPDHVRQDGLGKIAVRFTTTMSFGPYTARELEDLLQLPELPYPLEMLGIAENAQANGRPMRAYGLPGIATLARKCWLHDTYGVDEIAARVLFVPPEAEAFAVQADLAKFDGSGVWGNMVRHNGVVGLLASAAITKEEEGQFTQLTAIETVARSPSSRQRLYGVLHSDGLGNTLERLCRVPADEMALL